MAGGTVRAAREALRVGTAINIGGGFHHAHADHGSGFCLVADVAVAIRILLRDKAISRAAIVDCDVHQGDGNAAIFANDEAVYTLSFHQEDLFPFEKQNSDRDVPFASGITDDEYLELMRKHVPAIFDKHKPDIVVYIGGSDAHTDDQLGGALLTTEGIVARDEFVWSEARTRNIPFVMVLAGGYFPDCPYVHAESIGNICRLAGNA
jgi:acetoin utilization deacetylase AcuC-like enzyme